MPDLTNRDTDPSLALPEAELPSAPGGLATPLPGERSTQELLIDEVVTLRELVAGVRGTLDTIARRVESVYGAACAVADGTLEVRQSVSELTDRVGTVEREGCLWRRQVHGGPAREPGPRGGNGSAG
jgi:hypothetical protein